MTPQESVWGTLLQPIKLQCLYCGRMFEPKTLTQKCCKLGHWTSYRRRRFKFGDQPNRCPHTFKINYDSPEDAAKAYWARSTEHSVYLCWCGKWHYGRISRYRGESWGSNA